VSQAQLRLGQLIGSSDVPAEAQRRAAMDILSMPLGDPTREEAPGASVVRVECDDGVIALPADMFAMDKFDTDCDGELVARRVRFTRREYLRIVAARAEPGSTRPFSNTDDYEAIKDIYRDRGEDDPEVDPTPPVTIGGFVCGPYHGAKPADG